MRNSRFKHVILPIKYTDGKTFQLKVWSRPRHTMIAYVHLPQVLFG